MTKVVGGKFGRVPNTVVGEYHNSILAAYGYVKDTWQ